jgi:recombination protein RecT
VTERKQQMVKRETNNALDPKARLNDLATYLKKYGENNLKQAVQGQLSSERMIRMVLSDVSRNPLLLACTPTSIAGCLSFGAQVGLMVGGPLGYVYIIPRRNKHLGNAYEANPQLGYKGYCALAYRSKEIARLDAACVFRGEHFRFDRGTGVLEHQWSWEGEKGDADLVGAYAFAQLKGSPELIVEVLTRKQIEARRARSDSWRRNPSQSPWGTDFQPMARKSGILALLRGGRVPLSTELEVAVESEEESLAGSAPVEMEVLTEATVIENGASDDSPPTEDELRGMAGDTLFGERDIQPGDPTLTEDPG